MPRATFGGVTFDFLLDGLQDSHGGMVTVREIPLSGGAAYIDLGGALLARRTATIKVDSEADYRTLAALAGSVDAAGTLTSAAEGAPRPAVLLSVARTWRRGTGPQLCRTEWVFPTP